MALPSFVADAINTYGADAGQALGLVITAGVAVWALMGVSKVFSSGEFAAAYGAQGTQQDGNDFAYDCNISDRQEDFPDLDEIRQISAKEDRKAAEFLAAAEDFGGVEAYRDHMDQVEAEYMAMWAEQAAAGSPDTEYQRLGDVYQSWVDQLDQARAQGGAAPAAAESLDLYQRLVDKGMDAEDAIAAVEARNASVARSYDRELLQEEPPESESFDGFAVYESAIQAGSSHAQAIEARDEAFRVFQDRRLGL